jgi:uncharacterized membrane protein YheB (UPF0754 family)
MILSKEIQETAVNEYLKNNSVEKTQAFIDGMNKAFELIIPKEEPKQGTMSEAIKQVINNQLKQETLEEAAKSHAIYELENNYKPTKESFKLACKRSFIQGAKWQQEQINCELSELLEQRNEMLAMLENATEIPALDMDALRPDMIQLIKKVKDNG